MNYLAKKMQKRILQNATLLSNSHPECRAPSNQSIDHAFPVFTSGLRAKERPEAGKVREVAV